MSSPLKSSGPIVVGKLAAAPSNPENGMMYYDTVLGRWQKYEAGAFSDMVSTAELEAAVAAVDLTAIEDRLDDIEALDIVQNGRLDDLESDIVNKIDSSEKGAALGVATLDADSLIPITQIPPAALERLVIVADQAARFALTTSTVQNGDTVKQTDTNVMYFVKDDANLNSATGYSVYSAGTAAAVAWSGVTGTPTTLAGYGITDYAAAAKVAAVADSITDGITDVAPSQNAVFDALALKAAVSHTHTASQITDFTSAARTATVADSITDGVTNIAPSQNAVFDALALKLSSVSQDTAPQLGGNLDLNSKVILGDLERAALASPTNFITEKYIHSIALSGSQTNTAITVLQFAHASFEGCEIVAKVKEATSGDIKISTIRIVTNGTDISMNEVSVETADTGITFSAVISGANVVVRYSSGSNGATMRADVKLIAA